MIKQIGIISIVIWRAKLWWFFQDKTVAILVDIICVINIIIHLNILVIFKINTVLFNIFFFLYTIFMEAISLTVWLQVIIILVTYLINVWVQERSINCITKFLLVSKGHTIVITKRIFLRERVNFITVAIAFLIYIFIYFYSFVDIEINLITFFFFFFILSLLF